ncbi:MAG: peptide chain release factor N(5)-glutamine methyltransferase [Rickettsiales bacterium]|nr:peptide chain release factor N(5)-glutamine methyltransferase [Rickettsiales bacterium]
MKKISDVLAQARNQLEKSGVSNSKLDSLILLSHAFSFSKEQIIFNPDFELDKNQQEKFFALIDRRAKREPVSQIINNREFFGYNFFINAEVLDPRPDSESLIELVLKKFPPQELQQKKQNLKILELGCGSGCLIITLLKLYQTAKAKAIDISAEALKICQKNSILHKVENHLQLLQSDLFTKLKHDEKFDLIISNPPYIKTAEIETLADEVKNFEPRIALDGGFDGLDFYRKIAAEAGNFLLPNARIIIEIGFGQKEQIIEIFSAEKFIFEQAQNDLSSIARALCFKV